MFNGRYVDNTKIAESLSMNQLKTLGFLQTAELDI
jgi:hypothetical protein